MRQNTVITSVLGGAQNILDHGQDYAVHMALGALLHVLALNFQHRRTLNQLLYTQDGPLNLKVVWQSDNGNIAQTLVIQHGKIKVIPGIDHTADAYWIFRDRSALRAVLTRPPNEVLLMLLRSEMTICGNLSVSSLLNFLLAKLLAPVHGLNRSKAAGQLTETVSVTRNRTRTGTLKAGSQPSESRTKDKVTWLSDPFLSEYQLKNFPRLSQFLDDHFNTLPVLCIERPKLLTRWYREHGFEQENASKPWDPELRQAAAFAWLMENKQPIIRPDDCLGGTTTRHDVGVVLYPDAHATLIWGELESLASRRHNPYLISDTAIAELHHDILPFWLKRNFREWARENFPDEPCQQIEGRFAAYFCWKNVALSHTVVDIPSVLKMGTDGLITRIQQVEANGTDSTSTTLTAMKTCLQGINRYANNLSRQAHGESLACQDSQRKKELQRIAEACAQVPRQPARDLFEALQGIWLMWIALHMENTNAGLSLGRMDQWLQPYFEQDMATLNTAQQRESYVKQVIEWVGCFYLRCADHLPLVPDIGNYLFGGSSSDQAITLGGVDSNGDSAVNDMTWIFLKVTEMLAIRDPNVNARYDPDNNSDAYLQRLCEVNLVTGATPSIHGDQNIVRSLVAAGYPLADSRDWSAVGCVEPVISGQHMSHTGCIMFNLVAPLEFTLYQGDHPLMGKAIGLPIQTGQLRSYQDFYQAFLRQLSHLAEQATGYNNQLGLAHQALRPTPLLSLLITGCMDSRRDATQGGARFNSSGVACIGLADVVDSLYVIKKSVFEEQWFSLDELIKATQANFDGYGQLYNRVFHGVPKFGSGNREVANLAQQVVADIHRIFHQQSHYRNGRYSVGFWSMSNHVAFGTLSGALPSGHRAGQAFTPGLTPVASAGDNLLDNLLDVAALPCEYMPNNVAFNVKYVPAASDSREQSVAHMSAYVKTYCQQGGMQVQFNVVSSRVLRDAMAHPEQYRDLLVRISGYNAYFVTLNPDMQQELIARTEFCEGR